MLFIRKVRFDLAVALGCLTLLGYFGWHSLHGPRGFAFKDELSSRLAGLEAEKDALLKEQKGLEGKVALMRPEKIDPDMLEELARRELSMARPNEVLVFSNNQ